MTKNIIFIIAALCSLQARADVQPTERDTVHRTYRYDDTELLQPLQPLYLDGVVVPARGNGNWFVSIAGGTTAFLGTPLGCEDLFGRLKPSYSLAIGKWFTPWVGNNDFSQKNPPSSRAYASIPNPAERRMRFPGNITLPQTEKTCLLRAHCRKAT